MIPHAPPFRFVDGSGHKLVTVGEEPWPPLLLIECMAQACAQMDPTGRPGVLAALRDVRIMRAPRPGELLRIEVAPVGALGKAALFECAVFAEQEALARGRLAFKLVLR